MQGLHSRLSRNLLNKNVSTYLPVDVRPEPPSSRHAPHPPKPEESPFDALRWRRRSGKNVSPANTLLPSSRPNPTPYSPMGSMMRMEPRELVGQFSLSY